MNDLDEPLRLLRTRGHWTLEMTRMVPVDRHVLRPERRRVSGTDSVVRHLKERCSAPLVREALDLIVGQDDGSDQAFSLENERWVQLSSEAELEAPGGSTLAILSQVVSDLRAELTTLRALHEALRGRMAQVERRVAQQPLVESHRPAQRPALRQPSGGSLRPAALRGRSAAPAADARIATNATEISPEAAAIVPPAPVAAITPAAPTPKPELAVPPYAEIVTCLKQLLGSDPELRQEKGRLPKDLAPFYVARVIDASDADVGAILLDQAAGAELGGRLLGLPEGAFAEQAKGELSTDMLDAMNEVTNNLGGFINRANLDVRVRVRSLEKYDATALPWLAKCNGNVGTTTKTGGRLWIATI